MSKRWGEGHQRRFLPPHCSDSRKKGKTHRPASEGIQAINAAQIPQLFTETRGKIRQVLLSCMRGGETTAPISGQAPYLKKKPIHKVKKTRNSLSRSHSICSALPQALKNTKQSRNWILADPASSRTRAGSGRCRHQRPPGSASSSAACRLLPFN